MINETEPKEVIWLTKDAYDKLSIELESLSVVKRKEITDRIAAARAEGDLKENGGYHAARDEQGKNEARIRELEYKLKYAKIGSTSAKSGKDMAAGPGMIITVDLGKSEIRFLLGSREIADTTDLDVFSPSSPLGLAVDGKKVGEESSYTTPNGTVVKLKVTNVEAHA